MPYPTAAATSKALASGVENDPFEEADVGVMGALPPARFGGIGGRLPQRQSSVRNGTGTNPEPHRSDPGSVEARFIPSARPDGGAQPNRRAPPDPVLGEAIAGFVGSASA